MVRKWAIALAIAISACAGMPMKKAGAEDAPLHPKIAPDTLRPYDRKNWPKLFENYPEEIIHGRMMELRKQAALIAANDRRCDVVYAADHSNLRSIPPDGIEVFADCENGFRVRIDMRGNIMRGVK